MTDTITALVPLPIPADLRSLGTVISAVRLPDRQHNYPGYVVICHRSDAVTSRFPAREVREFSTHVAYSGDGGLVWSATTGHYDMTFAEATEDLLERAKRGI